jgi:hypothetical protein
MQEFSELHTEESHITRRSPLELGRQIAETMNK